MVLDLPLPPHSKTIKLGQVLFSFDFNAKLNMQPAVSSALSQGQKTPLVNLFAYLRDLYRSTGPKTDFEAEGSGSHITWWPLLEIKEWADQSLPQPYGDSLKMNLSDSARPLLKLKRIAPPPRPEEPEELTPFLSWVKNESGQPYPEIQSSEQFEDSEDRVATFRSFQEQVEGKHINEIGNIPIPENLDPWLSFEVDEQDQVRLTHYPTLSIKPALPEALAGKWQEFEQAYVKYLQIQDRLKTRNALYDQLHQAYYERSSQDKMGLVLSFGLLQNSHSDAPYRHFLFHVPLQFTCGQKEITIHVDDKHPIHTSQQFTELMPVWYPEASLPSLEARQSQIMAAVDEFNGQTHEFNFDPQYLEYHYHAAACRILDPVFGWEDRFILNGNPNWKLEEVGETRISLSFSPVLRFAEPEDEATVARDADRILRQLNQLIHEGQTDTIPDFFRHLFSLKTHENGFRLGYKRQSSKLRELGSTAEASFDAPDENRYFFPLPYNQEQLAIARRLEIQDAVTVKGPPGTGKSHSIANLLTHHASLGQRVLVISKNPKALEVIYRKLPPQIQEMAMLFREAAMPVHELKRSIEVVSDHLTEAQSDETLTDQEETLASLQDRILQLKDAVTAQLSFYQDTLSLSDPRAEKELTLTWSEWADRYQQLPERTHWLCEKLEEAAIPELVDLLQRWQQADHSLRSHDWPMPENWMDTSRLRSLADQIRRIEEVVDLTRYAQLPSTAFEPTFLDEWEAVQPHLQFLTQWRALWQHPGFRRSLLQQVVLEYGDRLNQLEARSAQFISFRFGLQPVMADGLDAVSSHLHNLMDKYDRDGTLSLLKRKLLPKPEKAFYECSINGKSVESYRDLRKIADFLKWQLDQQQLQATMENYFRQFDVIGLDQSKGGTPLDRARQQLSILKDLEAALVAAGHFNALAGARDLPILDLSGSFDETIAYLARLKDVRFIRKAYIQIEQAIRTLKEAGDFPLLPELTEAVENLEADRYEQLRHRYDQLRAEADRTLKLHQTLKAWSHRLPMTMARLEAGEVSSTLSEKELREDLFHLTLKQQLNQKLEGSLNVNEQLEEWKSLRTQQRDLISEVAALRGWAKRREAVGSEVLSNLAAWRNDLINVGKGHGKNTARHQASAKANLKSVKDAIPLWIMQQDLVSEFFDEPHPGDFDLLIIDEASQCDISTLNLIYRAKKSLVVGDENQTAVSTNANQFPIERTNQILDRYLIQHPFKQQFNINNRTASIYSLSGVIYPNIITLREHFRCRPEIIDFSDRLVYHRQIRPFRLAGNSSWGAAAEVHYVEDAPNSPRKPQIARQLVDIIRGMIEDFETGEIKQLPTIGVICLESSNEDHRELLIRSLGRDPKIKAYREQMELAVGTARVFQGDERDIMLLTTTASHSRNSKGKLRPPRAVLGEEMTRIYNVAMSRAREKVVLLHSILPEAIPLMKEQCLRRQLLDWMMESDLHPVKVSEAKLMAGEGSVMGEIQTYLRQLELEGLNYQLPIGGQVVPIALTGPQPPVGIFLDGIPGVSDLDASLNAQLTLERSGWQVYRLSALLWQVDRPMAEAQLRSWLGK